MSHNLNQLLSDFTQKPFALQETLQVFKDILVRIFPQIHFSTPHTQRLNGTLKSYTIFATPLKLGNDELGIAIFECESIKAKIGIHTELKSLLKDSRLNAILAIFYTTDSSEFRLSLITKTYNLDTDKLAFSNLKRQSFVLGQPKVATAHNALKNLIHSAKKSQTTLKDLESVFSQEAVSKEFYAQIITHYFDFLQGITFPSEASEYTQRSFALRLISRIIFCKFLEKKGIISDNLWDINLSADYYHEVLEPLFFTTLNTPQDSRDYGFLPPQIVEILSKIPYLNGGLFSPQQNDFYAPSYLTTLTIPNALFDNLFALLDRYSFTLDEYSHNDEEVSLNPELLGTIFESLLSQLFTDNKLDKLDKNSLRKATGSYYTPREIVRYMVRSAILLHLQTHLKGKVDSAYLQSLVFEDFAHSSSLAEGDIGGGYDFAKSTPNFCHTEGEARSIQKDSIYSQRGSIFDEKSWLCSHERGNKTKASIDEASGKLHDLSQKDNALILDTLSTLKILDPACGSGAFPMGILSEIIRLQDLLGDLRPHYARKLEILQSCIYGIDIQPMATEIARLRCFLSLIVDENPSDIKSLPNLEFKFISANSLLPLPKNDALQYDGYVRDMAELESLRTKYFNPDSTISKAQIQKSYTTLRTKIATQILATNAQDALDNPLLDYDPFNPHSTAQFFDSTYMFGVESFDIVIGNPPYIRQESIPNKQAIIQSYKSINFLGKDYAFSCSTADIYTYFFAKGAMLLSPKGNLIFITSNKFCRAGYGKNLREFLLGTTIQKYVDFNGAKVFDNATVDSCILQIYKENPKDNNIAYANPNAKDLSTISYSQIPQDSLSSEAFIFVDSPTLALKQKIERIGTPLKEWDIEIYRGVLTGYNEAFIIDTATRDRILADCDDSDKSRKPFLASGNSESSSSLARGDSKDSPSLAEGARGWVNLTEKERTAQIIKPILRGRDIKRYSYEWANLWLIGTFPALKLNINDYPALKKYLESFMPRIAQSGEVGCRKKTSNQWFETQDAIAYYEDFEKEILVWKTIGRHIAFAITEKGFCIANSTYFVSANVQILKYLQSILLSKIMKFYILQTADTTGAGDLMLTAQSLERLPIPKINAKNQKIADKIVNLVDKILQSKAQGKDSTTLPYPNATPPCHTTSHPCHTERSEVSQKQKKDLVDSSLSAKAQNDKRRDRDFSHSTNAQNDKTIKNCNDTSNHNKDISHTLNIDTTALESQIDKLVYQLYDLDSHEIKIIESKQQKP